MIIFSRKTNGCWVPQFKETPTWMLLGWRRDAYVVQTMQTPEVLGLMWPRSGVGGGRKKTWWVPNRLSHGGLAWRIIPVSKWLVSPIYKPFSPFGRGPTTLLRGLTITMVMNHLLNGMILQVGWTIPFLQRFWHKFSKKNTKMDRKSHGELNCLGWVITLLLTIGSGLTL